ncbi:MAG: molecular chaperone [Gammaproteobacteria bacterium]|nr:molecular chaperone [Gammaproteobacteria bacterium]
MKISKSGFLAFVTGVCFVLCSSLVFANIKISATSINMNGKSAVERVTNTSSKRVLVLHVFVKKVLKTKALVDTKDVVAFPRVLKLKPKQTKLVRLMLRHKPNKAQLYRLFLYEKPVARPYKKAANDSIQALVNFGLKISIPVHVVAKK